MNAWLCNTLLLAQNSQPRDEWTTTFFGLDPDNRFTLLIVAIGCATGVLCTLVVFASSTINSIGWINKRSIAKPTSSLCTFH